MSFLPFLLLTFDLIIFNFFSSWYYTPQPRTVLADGSGMMYGTLKSGIQWQSSGVFASGGCVPQNQSIADCYQMDLVGDPKGHLDPNHLNSPRQRIEFRSHDGVPDGSAWLFTWSSYYPSTLHSNRTFFHLLQVFSQADGGPVYYLDILRNRDATFKNHLTNTTLAKIPISQVFDTTLRHKMEVMFGPEGYIKYTLESDRERKSIMHVESEGYTGTGGCYMKFGLYRKTWEGMGEARAWYGDYTVKRLNPR